MPMAFHKKGPLAPGWILTVYINAAWANISSGWLCVLAHGWQVGHYLQLWSHFPPPTVEAAPVSICSTFINKDISAITSCVVCTLVLTALSLSQERIPKANSRSAHPQGHLQPFCVVHQLLSEKHLLCAVRQWEHWNIPSGNGQAWRQVRIPALRGVFF